MLEDSVVAGSIVGRHTSRMVGQPAALTDTAVLPLDCCSSTGLHKMRGPLGPMSKDQGWRHLSDAALDPTRVRGRHPIESLRVVFLRLNVIQFHRSSSYYPFETGPRPQIRSQRPELSEPILVFTFPSHHCTSVHAYMTTTGNVRVSRWLVQCEW